MNNAGAGGEGGPIAETSVEGFDRTIALLFSELNKFGLMNVRFLIFRRRVVTVGTKALTAAEMKRCHWIPVMVCQIKFTEWTRDDRLRQPVFLGIREDKNANEVVREKAS